MQAQKVFISYAHKDEEFRREMQAHLRLMERQGLIKSWHDREITAGSDWKEHISKNLREADIVILLVSADFLNSDYCYDVEMKVALDAHRSGSCLTIPVIVRPVANWENSPFGSLQALPTNAKPVSTWDNRDSAWADVVSGIITAVQRWELERAGKTSRDQRSLDDVVQTISASSQDFKRPTFSLVDVVQTISASSQDFKRPTFSVDRRTLEKNSRLLMLLKPQIASKISAYKIGRNLDKVAAKKAYDEVMMQLSSNLPIETKVFIILPILVKRKEQMIKLDHQLLSLISDIEDANLSAYDYGLPLYTEAIEKLTKDVKEMGELEAQAKA